MKSPVGIRQFPSDANVLAFPLGGIGTGNVSLGARGDLRDWEIFNHPGKGTLLPNTFFALWVKQDQFEPICKVLEGPISPPYTLSHGFHPHLAAGLPRMQEATFRGEYPFAEISFEDPQLPVKVDLEAYTPLIPLEEEDSGLPCAILTYKVKNLTRTSIKITIAGSLINPVGGLEFDPFGNLTNGGIGGNVNEYRQDSGFSGIYLWSKKYGTGDLQYGNLSLVTTHPTVTYKRVWLRSVWYDFLRDFWNDLSSDGELDDLAYETHSESGKTDTASLGAVDVLSPGEGKEYQFILTWFFPNRSKSWKKCDSSYRGAITRNHYALFFEDAWSVAKYVSQNYQRLEVGTRAFHRALFSSTYPAEVLDAISANIVPFRSTTCFWLEDGYFYGYEGCFDDSGCCEGTCTHVWSYAQTAAFLFPRLERNMRLIEFCTETDENGYMSFRTFKTFGEEFIWPWGDQKPEAAVDGQMGSILRVLREWRMSGDREWLGKVWPGVKRALKYTRKHWDSDGDGILDGRQHNTYDVEFYGPNPLCSIYYLAGLRTVQELARVMGEPDLAEECQIAFTVSSQKLDELLWNGEYFIQKLDDRHAHPYQHGSGCLSDQLLGQLHARIYDLGDLLPREHVRRAIKAVYDHNFQSSFRSHANCQRTFTLNDEAGLILCSWPKGGKPNQPFVYSDEVWTGVEYQVASHLIYEGWLEEGLAIVKAVRERHDGYRRNPWDEVECGHHYIRSMSSWGLMIALSGFQGSIPDRSISFRPGLNVTAFQTFFCNGNAWGIFEQRHNNQAVVAQIQVNHGILELERFSLSVSGITRSVIWVDGAREIPLDFEQDGAILSISIRPGTTIKSGQVFRIIIHLS
jgi:non-lysosomal glucosylceramidase